MALVKQPKLIKLSSLEVKLTKAGQKRTVTVSGSTFRQLTGCMVYVWTRQDEILYIGMSKYGFCRLSPHHVLNTKDKVRPTDEIRLVWLSTLIEAVELERDLIKKYKPKYNRGSVPYLIPLTEEELANKVEHEIALDELMKSLKL